MSADPRRPIDCILENYLLALACQDQCDASAPDDLRNRLAANLARAERAWADATADGLAEVPPDAEAELETLAGLAVRVRAALNAAAPIASLLTTLESGTDRAIRVVEAVLSR